MKSNIEKGGGVLATKKPETNMISLWIDSYSDIFSDFDPRSFSERAISDDFIGQVKKVSKETTERISVLRLLVPEGTQREDHEKIIRKRLQRYFENMHEQLQTEDKKIKIKSISFFISGIILMVLASYISYLNMTGFHINLLHVLFEPGGWFLFWTGLDTWLTFSKSRQSEVQFYNRMMNIHVDFSSYSN